MIILLIVASVKKDKKYYGYAAIPGAFVAIIGLILCYIYQYNKNRAEISKEGFEALHRSYTGNYDD